MEFYLSSLYQEMLGATIMFWPQFISGLLIFLLFCVLYIATGVIFKRLINGRESSRQHSVKFLKKFIRLFLIIFGFITMLGTWGIDISAIVAGLGLTGFALGFALKDALSSVLAGIMIHVYKPFEVGDTISTCGSEGVVSSIDLRYTTIESNGVRHLIPNSKLISEKVLISGR
ncbi:MAG: mechanosensitive ion channel [Alphaproteobacteria bacterium CG11_big_fil_rev_8_21_14_0_20_39_49]|nr:MAG: mechanosensitive ion channel [Alphaproteobacteria bacterium CG11_big_fil_rev_8_21_14_0_20_39_49]